MNSDDLINQNNFIQWMDSIDIEYNREEIEKLLNKGRDWLKDQGAKIIDISADALTTGGALYIASDSSSTGTRNVASIIQDHSSASGSTTLYLRNDHATADALKVVGAVTVGVDDTGHDVKFFGATTGQYMLWDESADELVLAGDSKLSFHDAAGGESIIASADGHLEIKAGTTLDITAATVDINAATLVQVDGAISVGVDDTGHDVKFFGATAGAFMEWDESADELEIRGPVATPGKLLLSTAEASVVDGNKLGQIDFQAPLDSAGTDAILVGASIWAEADDTFAADNNSTELVFAVGASEAAAEKMRLDHDGNLGIGTATPSAKLEVSGTITETSMREAKTNIENMDSMLPTVLQMQGVKFDWKEDSYGGKDNFGFIAEDMQEILPEVVTCSNEGKAAGIQYSKLTAVLVEAIKEQQIQIDELKSKLN